MAVKITLEFATAALAAAFLSRAGDAAPMNDPLPQTMQPAPAPQYTPPAPPQMMQPQPMVQPGPPQMMQQQPAQQFAAPSQPGYTTQTLQPLMQQFVTAFKPAGLKSAFAKFNLPPQISALDQNGLNVMGDYLQRCITAGQMVA